MIDANARIKEIIDLYKADFARVDSQERYKWIAVKHFQDNWDIDADDFASMLSRAFAKNLNLLDTGRARPLYFMVYYAKREPETVRNLFRTLYDESVPLERRIDVFSEGCELFASKMRLEDPLWKSTFQDKHAISVYLTFRYPENYYIYKYSFLKFVAPLLGIDLTVDRLVAYAKMCDSIREAAITDEELVSMNHKRLGSDCYQDPNNRMLAQDITHFAYHLQREKNEIRKFEQKPEIVVEFQKWLEAPTRNNGAPYDYKTVKVYVKQVEDEASKLVPPYAGNTNLYTYDKSESFAERHHEVLTLIDADESRVNGAFRKVLRLYEQFLKEREQPPAEAPAVLPVQTTQSVTAYNREKFLDEVYLTSDDYDSLINLLIRKKNLILQGAPGVGKTFAAKRLAYSLIGEKTSERIYFIQFHPSYGYEDFVMGYRPCDEGFKMVKGTFYTFCEKAAKDLDNDWYFIIDEINRGVISKIFGELLMLIEVDKRGRDYAVKLPGADDPFYVPQNVYIIGMMNTADRSIALIDYALRRRFAFYTLEPAFDKEGFRDYMEGKDSEKFNAVIEVVSKLNDEIAADPLLGAGFKIGHSYFCTEDAIDEKLLRSIIHYEIKPLLSEYWSDDADKVNEWTAKLLDGCNG